MPLDFTLIKNGEEFELLCEDILRAKGLALESRASRGPDAGADMIAYRMVCDDLGFNKEERILVECKHHAHSGRSVRETDVGNIIERTLLHNCNRYLLVTSTLPSTSVAQQLRGISSNPSIPITATAWSRNDLDGFLSEIPRLVERYFPPPPTHEMVMEKEETEQIIAVHLHSDFSVELHDMLETWNGVQSELAFTPVRPAPHLEVNLLAEAPWQTETATDLATRIKFESGFESEDGLIQFCEGRLHDENTYQLFSFTTWRVSDGLDSATISLHMMRKLASESALEAPIFAMILQQVLYALGSVEGLENHKDTRLCIMDYDDNMPDILDALRHGPQFCAKCKKQLSTKAPHLLELARAAKRRVHAGSDTSEVHLRMKLRDARRDEKDQTTYDVALSFAGEDRRYAEQLADELRKRGVRVFYDAFEQSSLWGQDLYTYLDDLYRFRARYCIMFLSAHYSGKLWTNHERRAAQARAFAESRTYILPVRLDETEIPGIAPTVGYITWTEGSGETIAEMVVRKLSE